MVVYFLCLHFYKRMKRCESRTLCHERLSVDVDILFMIHFSNYYATILKLHYVA